ncbi:MAG: hypothetical protein JJ863_01380 [Deltaproteobacteria bacterium]|nr:hypothetical protein [Deltaproteobacteria bacterium]
MSRPRAVRLAQARGDADTSQVLREFMAHKEWLAPISLFEGSEVADARKVSLGSRTQVPADEVWIFTEQGTAIQATRNGTLLGCYVSGVRGDALFRRLPEVASYVVINGGGFEDDRLDFDRQSFDQLVRWAEAVSLERAVAAADSIATNGEILARMRALDAWYLPLFGDGRMIAKAGHDGYDQPGVACTTPDSYAAFVNALDPQLRQQVKRMVVNGEGLCVELQNQTQVDALYLNPFGPGPTATIPRSVFDLIKTAGPPPRLSIPAPL